MLRIVTPRRLALAAFAFCLAAAGQVRAQSAQSYGSPQGALPSAQVAYAPAVDCGEPAGHGCFKLPKFHAPKFGHTVCTIPAGTVCEPAPCKPACNFKLPKPCLPKIYMPKIYMPKVCLPKLPKLCHKSACDDGCGEWAGAPAIYPSAQTVASPQAVASPQG